MAITNFVTVVGRLSWNPELKTTSTGKTFCQLSLVVSTTTKSKMGSNEEYLYIGATVWDEKAQDVARLKKGQCVALAGRLKTDEWQDKKTGEKKQKMSIVVSDILHSENLPSDIKQGKDSNEFSYQDEMPF